MILNELEYCRNMIDNNKFIEKDMSSIDLIILAKYFRWELNITGKKLKDEIIKFCENSSMYNPVLHDQKIDYACKVSKNFKLRIPKPIFITKDEVDILSKIKNDNIRKTLFGMLCIAKYYKETTVIVNSYKEGKSNKLYYNKNISDVLEIMKIKANKYQKYNIMFDIQHSNLVNVKYNGSYEILFCSSLESKIKIEYIDDILLYYEYLFNNGDNRIAFCTKCNRPTLLYGSNNYKKIKFLLCKKCKLKIL